MLVYFDLGGIAGATLFYSSLEAETTSTFCDFYFFSLTGEMYS